MAKTVTCLYSSDAEASSIVRRLEDANISQGKICLFTQTGNSRFWEGTSSFGSDASTAGDNNVAHYLTSNGVPADDAHAYAEGVRRGHALVAVRCDDDEVDRVVDILDNDDVLDIDERQDTWRSEGWTGYDSSNSDMRDASLTTSAGMLGGTGLSNQDSMRTRDRDLAQGSDEVIPVAEEELHVGKRDVNRGRVRIRSHVVERPVQEQVTLTEERVAVERRPVEGTARAATLGDKGDLFRERTIEMEERAEEAVVSKEARVVEEVVVRKDADQRTETISDTVRKTEVEVDDERDSTISRTGTTDKDR
jgi:uncharacterized protein (TIGR02271 family)